MKPTYTFIRKIHILLGTLRGLSCAKLLANFCTTSWFFNTRFPWHACLWSYHRAQWNPPYPQRQIKERDLHPSRTNTKTRGVVWFATTVYHNKMSMNLDGESMCDRLLAEAYLHSLSSMSDLYVHYSKDSLLDMAATTYGCSIVVSKVNCALLTGGQP